MRALLYAVLLLASVHQPASAQKTALPTDVQKFLERREGCDHWRGEEPYDDQRRAEINKNACELCTGTDAQLSTLKRKYKRRSDVLMALQHLESKIELPSPQALAKMCKKAVTPSRAGSSPNEK